jgi:hypothetical protein
VRTQKAPTLVAAPAADRPRPAPRRDASPWLRRALVFAICALLLDALFGDRGLAETRRGRSTPPRPPTSSG